MNKIHKNEFKKNYYFKVVYITIFLVQDVCTVNKTVLNRYIIIIFIYNKLLISFNLISV